MSTIRLDAELTAMVQGEAIVTDALYRMAELHIQLVPDSLASEEFFGFLESTQAVDFMGNLRKMIRDEEA